MKIKRSLNWPTCAPQTATHLSAALVLLEATVVVDDAQIPENTVQFSVKPSLAPLHYPNERKRAKRRAEMTRRLITSLVGVPLLAGTSSCPLIGCLALPLSFFYSLLDVQLLRSTKHWRTWTWGTNHMHLQHTEYTNPTKVGTLQGKA